MAFFNQIEEADPGVNVTACPGCIPVSEAICDEDDLPEAEERLVAEFWQRALRTLASGNDGTGFTEYAIMIGVAGLITVSSVSMLGSGLESVFVSTVGRLPSTTLTSAAAIGMSDPVSLPLDSTASSSPVTSTASAGDVSGQSSGDRDGHESCGGDDDTRVGNSHSEDGSEATIGCNDEECGHGDDHGDGHSDDHGGNHGGAGHGGHGH